jgi:hypothetical protein
MLWAKIAYLEAFLCAAQRRLAASAIRARPSGDSFRAFSFTLFSLRLLAKRFQPCEAGRLSVERRFLSGPAQ